MGKLSSSIVAIASAVLVMACTDADGTTTGGEIWFPPQSAPPPVVDAGSDDAAATWMELYGAYFGKTGKATCTFASNCHIATNQPDPMSGAAVWQCGDSPDSCYNGMIHAGVVPEGGTSAPEHTTLYGILRKAPNMTGAMPKEPDTVVFTSDDLARIASWIAAGAKEN
jgi:hypothetical protein